MVWGLSKPARKSLGVESSSRGNPGKRGMVLDERGDDRSDDQFSGGLKLPDQRLGKEPLRASWANNWK